MKINKRNSFLESRKFLLVVALISIAVVCAIILYSNNRNGALSTQAQKINTETEISKTSSNATKDSPADTDSKNVQSEETGAPIDSTSSTKTVTPFISFFGRSDKQIEVDAYIPGINENGTCTLTVTDASADTVFTATKPASSDAQYTRCENFIFEDNGANTSWKAIISFKSSSHEGTSKAAQFN